MSIPVILVVEDDALVREVTQAALERDGFAVLQAGNGPEAIATFQARGDEISLVLLDWVLPGLDGSAIVPRLKEIRPDVKILVTSGYAHLSALPLIARKQVQGFLGKPYLPAQLLRKIRQVLGPSQMAARAAQ